MASSLSHDLFSELLRLVRIPIQCINAFLPYCLLHLRCKHPPHRGLRIPLIHTIQVPSTSPVHNHPPAGVPCVHCGYIAHNNVRIALRKPPKTMPEFSDQVALDSFMFVDGHQGQSGEVIYYLWWPLLDVASRRSNAWLNLSTAHSVEQIHAFLRMS
jgi:hypothetical protein